MVRVEAVTHLCKELPVESLAPAVLLVGILLTGCESASDEDLAVAKIESMGRRVDRDANHQVIGVNLNSKNLQDDEVGFLKVFSKLENLNLSQTAITDRGLAAIQDLTSLKSLDLSGTRITGAGLAQMKGLKNIKTLKLNNCPIANDGLAPLDGSTQLEVLDLSNTHVGDEGLAHLKGIERPAHPENQRYVRDGRGTRAAQGIAQSARVRVQRPHHGRRRPEEDATERRGRSLTVKGSVSFFRARLRTFKGVCNCDKVPLTHA